MLALPVGKFTPAPTSMLAEATARARMAAAQLEAVETQSAMPDGSQRHPRLLEQYGYRARAATRFSEAEDSLSEHRKPHFSVILDAVAAGRAELLRLHRAGEIHDSVLHTLEEELDLEEMRARQAIGDAT